MQRDERDMAWRLMVGSLHPSAIDLAVRKVAAGLMTEDAARASLGYPTLDYLAEKYGTDKGPVEHNYTPLYDQRFRAHRTESLTLLELGIWKGASLLMWRDYFPNATIIGLDRVHRTSNAMQRADIVTFHAEQDDEQAINELGSLYGPLHIVIDDASHISSKTIASFKLLWPHVAPGGTYVIEDLQTSYDPEHYGTTEASLSPDHPPRNFGARYTAMQFCKRLADEVNAGLYPEKYRLGYDIASVEFHLNICFITKAGKWAAE